ncbi:conserved hypothetical protein [Talaromyces stipitatus ATCC 10500]|uniref:NADH dehydrogenase [ubiquinone] 1 alpha subcomplex assembly factor 3 n=1 Tax=Talaromyces stipitatus (strain ATCC 10500 / CBS 375.48 / QM 6759 / NRRL 1006) TaxID=441959 RepID=B8MEF3_TALSN|nr:uncharacterized protein TSTA_016570 [Talaromyces stipitatus ATCC 10500]EED16580.1 conserved hypothetical protein [Talaromyces stipitatus ATCC 10500]
MLSPSPQLLRVLRTSIANDYVLTSGPSHPIRHSLSSRLSYRKYSSGNTNITPHRPSRVAPRSQPPKPQTHDRGPRSDEKTQTDFAELNVFGNIPTPATAVDACLDDGFHLDNGVKITNGDGVLLVAGEAFAWRPWQSLKNTDNPRKSMVNEKGQFELPEEAWGLLSLVWPRPDILIIGLGSSIIPLSPQTKRHVNSLGIRVDVQDTRNASAQFNLLATERGVTEVAAAMIPVGWSAR